MDLVFAARKYVKYRMKAMGKHDVHSPFVFELLNNVIRDKTPYYGFDLIESLRAQYLLNQDSITITDFGTGKNNRREKISVIAKNSAQSKKYGQLLFRLVNRFQSENILEIGTSLGFSTLYLSMPKKDSKIITLEGCPEVAILAKRNFKKLKRDNIELIEGDFSETLLKAFTKFSQIDMVYFDGNHQRLPTLNYFESCLSLAHENSVFIFDDIHWSKDMEAAWEEIKNHASVSLSIDLYKIGIVFFKKGIVRQHFVLKY